MNSVEDLTPDCLGHAGLVYEYTLVSRTQVQLQAGFTPPALSARSLQCLIAVRSKRKGWRHFTAVSASL